ncbi:MAG: hypothetical protein Fues2KO_42660 [Fuerstiella sp.]
MFRITLIGPDGAGKSAVAELLLSRMPVPARRIYMGVKLDASNVMIPTARLQRWIRRRRNVRADTEGPRDPNVAMTAPRSAAGRLIRFCKSGLRTIHLIADEIYRLCVIRWWLARGFVVIQDRDYFVDYYEYDIAAANRSFWQRVHGHFLRRLYRKPELTLLLDASANVMLDRKQEGTLESLQRRRDFYQSFLKQMPDGRKVDAAVSLHDVTTQCLDHVMQLHGERKRSSIYGAQPLNGAQSAVTTETLLPPVILVGLDCVTGLQSARLLQQRGVRVIGLAARPKHFCCRTNSVERLVVSETHGPGLLRTLDRLHREFNRKPVLLPCTDLSVLTLSADRERLQQQYCFVLPNDDLVRVLIDKVSFADFAQQNGLPVPGTRILTDSASTAQAAAEMTFPVFLKPAIKTPKWEANTALKAVRTESPEDLKAAWHRYSKFSTELIAQEYIHGQVSDCYTVNVYVDQHGQLQQLYTSRKDRQWPPDFGTACAAHAVANTEVEQLTVEFFRNLDYRGLGYLEFKQDQRTGRYLIIEPNIGRPTGRSAMAEACGVPLLWTAYCDAAGLSPDSSPNTAEWNSRAAAGVIHRAGAELKWVHLRRDLQAAVRGCRRNDFSLWQWLRSVRGKRIYAVLNRHDLRPFLTELRHYALRLVLGRSKRRAVATPTVQPEPTTLQQP